MKKKTILVPNTPPSVFISYSHDSESHKKWVLQLATRLRANGVDIVLDAWNIRLGTDLAQFMETGLSSSKRVICICTDEYIAKADTKTGGAGYEKQIMTATMLHDLNRDWIIPLVRSNSKKKKYSSSKKLPLFLDGKLYVDFTKDEEYETNYGLLLRDIHDAPLLPIPLIGPNPFDNISKFSEQVWIPSSEKYVSPGNKGRVDFDYSNNDGKYSIGQGLTMFELQFSKASDTSIYILNYPPSIHTVALAKGIDSIYNLNDVRIFDSSSRTRTLHLGQIAVVQNKNGYYAAVQILSIADDTRNASTDNVSFDYIIQVNGSPNFTEGVNSKSGAS
jgi:hypothetical protein